MIAGLFFQLKFVISILNHLFSFSLPLPHVFFRQHLRG